MKSFITIACSMLCFGLFAQISINNSMFPAAGNEFYLQTTTNLLEFSISAPGPNQTWDYTQLSIDANDTLKFYSPQEGAYASSFPQADLMLNMMGAEVYGRTLVNRIELIGMAGQDPIGIGFLDSINLKIDPPMWLFEAPLGFNQSSTHTSEIKITLGSIPELDALGIDVDSVRLKAITKREDVVDAWGTLQINLGTFNVIRQKQISINTPAVEFLIYVGTLPIWVDPSQFGLDLGLPSDTSTTYYYFAEGEVGPVAIVEANNESVIQVQQRSGDNIVSAQNLNALNDFRFYPNPASTILHIESPEIPEKMYELQLFDIAGRMVVNQKLAGFDEVNLEALPAGNYMLHVLENNRSKGAKSLVIR